MSVQLQVCNFLVTVNDVVKRIICHAFLSICSKICGIREASFLSKHEKKEKGFG